MLTDKHKGTKLASVLIDRDQIRGGSRAAVTSKMERFVIIVNGWKPWEWNKKKNNALAAICHFTT